MKRFVLAMSVISATIVGFSSCKKEQAEKAAITQTYSVALKANEAYTFTLPKNTRNDAYEFTTAASHASISEIGTDASGNPMYSYTPVADYVGTDVVVLSNDYERAEHPQHTGPKPLFGPKPKKDCKGGEEDHYIVTINFTVDNATAQRSK